MRSCTLAMILCALPSFAVADVTHPTAEERAAGVYAYRFTRDNESTFLTEVYWKDGQSYHYATATGGDDQIFEEMVLKIEALRRQVARTAYRGQGRVAARKDAPEIGKVPPSDPAVKGSDHQKIMVNIPAIGDDPRGYRVTKSDGQDVRVLNYVRNGNFYKLKRVDGYEFQLFHTSVRSVRMLPKDELAFEFAKKKEEEERLKAEATRGAELDAKAEVEAKKREAAEAIAREEQRVKDGQLTEVRRKEEEEEREFAREENARRVREAKRAAQYEAEQPASFRGDDSSSSSMTSYRSSARSTASYSARTSSRSGYYTGSRQSSGHYVGGVGSSHKGGHYVNAATGNRYQSRGGRSR